MKLQTKPSSSNVPVSSNNTAIRVSAILLKPDLHFTRQSTANDLKVDG